jgi:hypothetical protein
MPLAGTISDVDSIIGADGHPELVSDLLDGSGINLCRMFREPALGAVEPEQHRTVQPLRAVLCHHEIAFFPGQNPLPGSITVFNPRYLEAFTLQPMVILAIRVPPRLLQEYALGRGVQCLAHPQSSYGIGFALAPRRLRKRPFS